MPEQAELLTNTLGELLASARRARNLSQADVAQQLKLQVDKIELLETDQWQQFSPAFAKGYAQQYGQFVGIPADLLTVEVKRIDCKAAPMKRVFSSSDNQRTNITPYLRIFAYLAVIVLVLLALLWAYTTFTAEGSEGKLSLQPAEQTHSALAKPIGKLEIELSADSWLSISDANGQSLEAALKTGGMRYQYQGEPPYQLQIGRISAARVWLDGRSVELPALLSGGVANISVATNIDSIN